MVGQIRGCFFSSMDVEGCVRPTAKNEAGHLVVGPAKVAGHVVQPGLVVVALAVEMLRYHPGDVGLRDQGWLAARGERIKIKITDAGEREEKPKWHRLLRLLGRGVDVHKVLQVLPMDERGDKPVMFAKDKERRNARG
jgi:hypothetical protein